jgi:hypothetical protein
MLRAILTRLAIVSLVVPTFLALVPAGPALANPGLTVQDQTTAGVTPTSLAQSLAGAGVTISNVTYAGTTRSSGQFQGGTTIIGFDSGVILSSGFATDVIGPNTSDNTTRINGTGSDADLAALSGFPIYDKTVLEFDLVPQAATLTFQYVFASEEYNEYANSPFNDVFAFLVNGTNCATVPGTVPPQPVSINTINGGNPLGTNPKNPVLYRNNDLSDGPALIDTQADGLTVVLTCTATVNPGVTNHVKLAIADASDAQLDSYVFLKAGSFVSSNITLAPATDTNPTGTTHTVTATVTENGQPAPGKVVTFTVTAGPHIGMTGVGTTNASGQATFTYTGVNAGTDTIKASYVSPIGPQDSNAVTKIWEFVGAATLTLSPKADSNPVRTQHCVIATALNTAGAPAMNVLVRFSVSGSVTVTGSDTTDATGQAEFCYSGPTFPGDDLISAYADNNKNGTQQADEPGDTATKAWVIPTSSTNCKVTFGGRITAMNGDKATFGGNANATPSGNIQYTDHGPADAADVHSTDVLAVVCGANGLSATIYGEAMDSGTGPWMFRIDLTDLGEPGRDDTFRIQLTNGYDSGEQKLEKGGNIQLH